MDADAAAVQTFIVIPVSFQNGFAKRCFILERTGNPTGKFKENLEFTVC